MKKQKESFKKALALIKDRKFLIDADLLARIEDAENGDMNACFKLASGFGSDMKGHPKDYNMAMYYMNKLKASPVSLEDPMKMFSVLSQDALIEDVFKHYDLAAEKYVTALKYMVANLPAEDWDYTFLKWMSGIKDFQTNPDQSNI